MRPTGKPQGRSRRRDRTRASLLLLLALIVGAFPEGASSEQASQPSAPVAAGLDAGGDHSCALSGDARARCWGSGAAGQLGYGDRTTIGDNEAPGFAGPVNLGIGRTARALGAGLAHSCAVADDGSVRCWGYGGDGQLGYANTNSIGDNESPASAGPVELGPGETAVSISAGANHTCAVLNLGTVRCWGNGFFGQLGNGRVDSIGDDETPGSPVSDGDVLVPRDPVDLGAGRTASAITAGTRHTCALLNDSDVLDDSNVVCWGNADNGQLGYGNRDPVSNEGDTPGEAGPVNLGAGRRATAISAGDSHTCAVLDDRSVRCWGFNHNGQLGYANTNAIGDDEAPGSVPPVNLGTGRGALAISAGSAHTCALLDDASVRCWGLGADGRLGYANRNSVGDNEHPGSVGPVNLGPGRSARAISAGGAHTCARLDDASVRCWGSGANGRLGQCNTRSVGDDETPGAIGSIRLTLPAASGPCGALPAPARRGGTPSPSPARDDGLEAQTARLRNLRTCLTRARRHAKRETRRARRLTGTRRARAKRHIKRHRSQLRRRCLKRWGRTPGRVTGLRGGALSMRSIVLEFNAASTDGLRPPAAHTYLVKQSRRPIRSKRAFRRAQTLCNGRCRFACITRIGARLTLTVTNLRRATTYYYAIAARDNVSRRLGRRSRTVKVRTLSRPPVVPQPPGEGTPPSQSPGPACG